MAKKICFLWKNWFDDINATVTSHSAAADYPVTLMQNRWKYSVWRSNAADAGGEWIKVDLGGVARDIKAIVLENMNLRAGSTVILYKGAGDPGNYGAGSAYITIPVTAKEVAARRLVVIFTSTQTDQWWRLDMLDNGNPDTYLSAGRMYLGSYFEPTYSFRSPWSRRLMSNSVISVSAGEQASANKRRKYWTYSLPIQIVGEADAESFMEVDETCGKDTPFWICMDPADPAKTTIYARFTDHLDFSVISKAPLRETTLNFQEEL